ncbi:MAG: hypothetical protein RJA99_601 [Pseudomonadota bacterium]|jgi:hypothetical protein
MEPLPPDVRPELVMNAAAIDGHSVTALRFGTRAAPEAVAGSLREAWRAQGLSVVESRTGDWWLLSVRDGAATRTVQLRATRSGSEGLDTRWVRDAHAPAANDDRLPPVVEWLPGATRVLRRMVHHDPGRRAATVVALVPAGTREVSAALRRGAAGAGFVDDPALGGPAARAAWYRGDPDRSGEALAFRRDREEVVATVAPHASGTAVVLHWGAPR